MGKRVFLYGTVDFQVPDIVRENDCECSVWIDGVTMVVNGREVKFSFNDPICSAIGGLNQISCSFRSEPISKKTWENRGLEFRSSDDYLYNSQLIDKIVDLDFQFCFRDPKTGKWTKWDAKKVASMVPFYFVTMHIGYYFDAKMLSCNFVSHRVLEQYVDSLRD